MAADVAEPVRSEVRVPPRWCDAQGMVHATRYHEVLEDAFLNWLDTIGQPYTDLRSRGTDLVIGASTIRHCGPARLGDTLEVTVDLACRSRSTITIRFSITRADTEPVADAEVIYVAVHNGTAAALPPPLAANVDTMSDYQLIETLHHAQRQFYAGGSADALQAMLHPDVTWHVPGSSPIAGTYTGRHQVLDYMRRRRNLADNTFQLRRTEVLIGPTHIAALVSGTASIGGTEQRWDTVGLYRRRGNQISECFLVPLDQQAFDRAWTTTS